MKEYMVIASDDEKYFPTEGPFKKIKMFLKMPPKEKMMYIAQISNNLAEGGWRLASVVTAGLHGDTAYAYYERDRIEGETSESVQE